MISKDNAFSWRLRCAIQATKKKQREICSEIGISAPTLSQYLAGNRDPSIATVAALAKALQVSTDYLLGLSSVTHPSTDYGDLAEKYDFRDTTFRFFNELRRNFDHNNSAATYVDGIPDEYKQYVNQENWTYLSGVYPIVDAQSFFYDILEHPKMGEIFDHVFYYQIARSYLRILKDRRVAYSENLNDREKWYAACHWDSPDERIRQYEKLDEKDRTLFDLYRLVDERKSYYVEGIPSMYADKAVIYREQIKKSLCQIIDDCCDKFELSHDQYFQQKKDEFIANMKNLAMVYATTFEESHE